MTKGHKGTIDRAGEACPTTKEEGIIEGETHQLLHLAISTRLVFRANRAKGN